MASWSRLRAALWPDATTEEHRRDVLRQLAAPEVYAAFVVLGPDSAALGFAEASVRNDYVNGCGEPPVAFLEGLYVDPAFRRQGLTRRLLQAVETWARAQGCRELASDAGVANVLGQAVHRRLGFEETERVVFFRKAFVSLAGRPTEATAS